MGKWGNGEMAEGPRQKQK